MALRFRKSYLGKPATARCPLCGDPDSGSHILGACKNRHLKGLYIERHNEAVAALGRAIMQGAKGGCLSALVADAGWHGTVTGLAELDRIPQQALPNVPAQCLRRMRPDMLIFERPAHGDAAAKLEDLQSAEYRRTCKVHVVEVVFCMEVSYLKKHQEKHKQHEALLDHFKLAGYAEVHLHLLILGSTLQSSRESSL